MVIPNNERVGRGLTAVRDGIRPVCELAWATKYGEAGWPEEVHGRDRGRDRGPIGDPDPNDLIWLLKGMQNTWQEVWRYRLGQAERGLKHADMGFHAHQDQLIAPTGRQALVEPRLASAGEMNLFQDGAGGQGGGDFGEGHAARTTAFLVGRGRGSRKRKAPRAGRTFTLRDEGCDLPCRLRG